MSLDIVPVQTRAHDHQNNAVCVKMELCHPFSASLIGGSGSGKSVLAVNLLTNPNLFGGYFDKIYLVGATVHSDDTWKSLNVPKNQQFTNIATMIPQIERVIRKQKADVEQKGVAKAQRICIVFEDVTTNLKLLNSAAYIQSYVQNRHLNCSTLAMCHKFTAQTRVCRLNSGHHFIFAASKSEVARIVSETMPHNLDKAAYTKLINYAWTPTKQNPKPFLWINFKAGAKDINSQLRKNLNEIITNRNAQGGALLRHDVERRSPSTPPRGEDRRRPNGGVGPGAGVPGRHRGKRAADGAQGGDGETVEPAAKRRREAWGGGARDRLYPHGRAE